MNTRTVIKLFKKIVELSCLNSKFAQILRMIMNDNISAFVELGKVFRYISGNKDTAEWTDQKVLSLTENLENHITDAYHYNGWYTPDMVNHMIEALGAALTKKNIVHWLDQYADKLVGDRQPATIAIVMAGNIPLVGFHDMMCVLVSGNRMLAKLSSDDKKLIPAVAELLTYFNPGFKDKVIFTDGKLEKFDAVIATGSNNTSRYFEYYFGKYPNIIRRNRNGVALLNGNETKKELEGLADDVFLYYGLGCRNVSKIYVPLEYDLIPLLQVLELKKSITENHKYFNNYEYNKAIYLVNSTRHYDTGTLLLTESEQIASSVSVLYYEYYNDIEVVYKQLNEKMDAIQCIVTNEKDLPGIVDFGDSQQPNLWDYADGVDTMKFCLSIDDEKINY